MREANARREDGGRPEEPPGLQFLRAPERWEARGRGKLVGFWGEGASFCVSGGRGGREAKKGKRSGERPGLGEGGREGPGRRGCALRPATMQPPPRLPDLVGTDDSKFTISSLCG